MDKQARADDLISGRLKRSPSYASELGGKTVAELEELACHGTSSDKAGKMLKLIRQADRLRNKLREHRP